MALGLGFGLAPSLYPADSGAIQRAAQPKPAETKAVSGRGGVTLELLNHRYRKSVYLSRGDRDIHLKLRSNTASRFWHRIHYAVEVDGQMGKWRKLRKENDLKVPLPVDQKMTKLEIVVRLRGLPDQKELRMALKVIPAAEMGSEVLIDGNLRTWLNGTAVFLRGFYTHAPENLQAISAAGYNMVITYETDLGKCIQFLDECQAQKLMGMIFLPKTFVGTNDETGLRRAIAAVKFHPALLGYYLFDEPSPTVAGQTPKELKVLYEIIADEDPYHPVAICLEYVERTQLYEIACDVIMPDPYPLVKFPKPMTMVSDRVDQTRHVLDGRKPTWLVAQAFGLDRVEDIPDPEKYRTPTAEQARCMSYLALVHGADGLVYYRYYVYLAYDKKKEEKGQWPLAVAGYLPGLEPELWEGLAILGKEMQALEPMFLGTTKDSSVVDSVHWRLMAAAGGRRTTLIAVNDHATREAVVWIPMDRPGDPRIRFGNGRVVREANSLVVTLPPYGTLACEL